MKSKSKSSIIDINSPADLAQIPRSIRSELLEALAELEELEERSDESEEENSEDCHDADCPVHGKLAKLDRFGESGIERSLAGPREYKPIPETDQTGLIFAGKVQLKNYTVDNQDVQLFLSGEGIKAKVSIDLSSLMMSPSINDTSGSAFVHYELVVRRVVDPLISQPPSNVEVLPEG